MPTTCPNLVTLAAASLLLLIPFFTLAAPTMAPTASTPDSPTGMTRRVIFDIGYALVLFIFITGTYAWLGGWFDSVSLRVLTDNPRVRAAYRTFTDWLGFLRLDTLFQWLADAIIGTQTIPATDGGGALPAPQILPPQPPTPDSEPRPGGVTATPDPATSPSDHHHLGHSPPV